LLSQVRPGFAHRDESLKGHLQLSGETLTRLQEMAHRLIDTCTGKFIGWVSV